MDIAKLSTMASRENIMAKVNVAMMKKTKDMAQQQGDAIVKMMEQSVAPNLGQNVDVKL